MAFVQRANVVLEVKDDAVERMRDMGYSVIDEYGNVLKGSNIETIGSVKKELAEIEKVCNQQKEKIASLEDECEKLKKEIASLRKTKSTKKK